MGAQRPPDDCAFSNCVVDCRGAGGLDRGDAAEGRMGHDHGVNLVPGGGHGGDSDVSHRSPSRNDSADTRHGPPHRPGALELGVGDDRRVLADCVTTPRDEPQTSACLSLDPCGTGYGRACGPGEPIRDRRSRRTTGIPIRSRCLYESLTLRDAGNRNAKCVTRAFAERAETEETVQRRVIVAC